MGAKDTTNEEIVRAALKALEADEGRDRALDDELADLPMNDLGNSQRLRARYGQGLLKVREVGWAYWDGAMWQLNGGAEGVQLKAQEASEDIRHEARALFDRIDREGEPAEAALVDKMARRLWAWSIASGDRTRLAAMINELEPRLTVPPESLDPDPFVINLENGTLPLVGGCDVLEPHRPERYCSKMVRASYHPEAEAPLFHRFLSEVQPDAEVRGFLQAYMGYCLTGSIREQKLVFNWGEGQNGKSVFMDLMARLLADYATTLPFSSFIRDDKKRGGDATPDLADLPKVRFVIASEPEKGHAFAEAAIKAMTGGGTIKARHLRHNFFSFMPEFKIMLAGNHKPFVRGTDYAIWRRLLLVPWAVTVVKPDEDLAAKLWQERNGILNWLLDGCRHWLEHGLVIPGAVKGATDAYRSDSDPVGRFINEALFAKVGTDTACREVYRAYERWCSDNAERKLSEVIFSRAMQEHGQQKILARVRCWQDVEIVEGYEAATVPSGDGGGYQGD